MSKHKKPLLFTNINGGLLTPSKPGKWMHQLEKDHNLPYVTPHGLRHLCPVPYVLKTLLYQLFRLTFQ